IDVVADFEHRISSRRDQGSSAHDDGDGRLAGYRQIGDPTPGDGERLVDIEREQLPIHRLARIDVQARARWWRRVGFHPEPSRDPRHRPARDEGVHDDDDEDYIKNSLRFTHAGEQWDNRQHDWYCTPQPNPSHVSDLANGIA